MAYSVGAYHAFLSTFEPLGEERHSECVICDNCNMHKFIFCRLVSEDLRQVQGAQRVMGMQFAI